MPHIAWYNICRVKEGGVEIERQKEKVNQIQNQLNGVDNHRIDWPNSRSSNRSDSTPVNIIKGENLSPWLYYMYKKKSRRCFYERIFYNFRGFYDVFGSI